MKGTLPVGVLSAVLFNARLVRLINVCKDTDSHFLDYHGGFLCIKGGSHARHRPWRLTDFIRY